MEITRVGSCERAGEGGAQGPGAPCYYDCTGRWHFHMSLFWTKDRLGGSQRWFEVKENHQLSEGSCCFV